MGKNADAADGTKSADESKGKSKKGERRSGALLGPFTTVVGALLVIAALMCDSFGEHVLRGWLQPPSIVSWSVAAKYHMSHAVALVGIGVYIELAGRSLLLAASAFLLMLGTALFSGSLYLAAFWAHELLNIMPLVGGTVLLLGWMSLALHTLKRWRVKAVALAPAPPPA